MSTDRILSQLLGSGAATGFAGGLAGGLASGLLTSKSGRKFGKKALEVGGIAAIGGLAYAAFSRYRENQELAGATAVARTEPVVPDRFVPAPDRAAEADALALILLRAMIAAAQADGRLDGAERAAIYERVGSLDLSDVEKANLLAQLEDPVDMGALVAAAATPEIAAEIYTASLLAIELDTPAERAYLAMLAARLGLPDGLVATIHHQIEVADSTGEAAQPAPRAVAP